MLILSSLIPLANNFETYEKRDLLVSNSLFQLLNMLEKERENFPLEEFAQKRFETLYELVFSSNKLKEETLRKKINSSKSSLDFVFDIYNNIYHKIKSSQTKKVLDQIYAGKSVFEVMNEEKVSLDQVILSLREIEVHMRKDLDPNTIRYFPGHLSSRIAEVKEARRENLEDLVIGYTTQEIAYRRKVKKISVADSLIKFRQESGINVAEQKNALNRIHNMNLGDPNLIFLDRLFRLIVRPNDQMRLIDLNRETIQRETGLEPKIEDVYNRSFNVVKAIFDQYSQFQQDVLKMKMQGFSNGEVGELLGTEHYNIRQCYKSILKSGKKSVGEFIDLSEKIPAGVDIFKYVQLTDNQKRIFELYFQGHSAIEIQSILSKKHRGNVLNCLQKIRGVLGLTVEEFSKIRKYHLAKQKPAYSPKLKLLQTIFPGNYSKGLNANDVKQINYQVNIINSALDALTHLHKVGGFTFSDPSFFIKHINNNQSPYQVYLAQKGEVNGKGETSVLTAIRSTTKILQDIFDNMISEAKPKGIDLGKWLLLDKTQKQAYLLKQEGKTYQQISDILKLGVTASTMQSRISTILKLLNA